MTISQCALQLSLVVRVLSTFGKSAMSLAAGESEGGVAGPRLHEALLSAVDGCTEHGDQGIEFITRAVAAALTKLRYTGEQGRINLKSQWEAQTCAR